MKESRKKLIVASFIIFILVSSTLGFIFGGSSSSSSYDYNGYKFRDNGQGVWITHIGNTPFGLSYDPRSLEDISFSGISLDDLNSVDKIYLSFNPSEVDNSVISEFHSRISPFLRNSLTIACSEDVEGCEELPIKTCDDIRSNQKVIMIVDGELDISYDGGCLVIRGDSYDLVRAIDRVIWSLLRVM